MPWQSPSNASRRKKACRKAYDRAYNQQDHRRKDPRKTRRWKKLRELVLKEQPLCADPYSRHANDGRAVAATQVDHIKPLAERPDLVYVRSNLQGLCTSCHAQKTADERRSIGLAMPGSKGTSIAPCRFPTPPEGWTPPPPRSQPGGMADRR